MNRRTLVVCVVMICVLSQGYTQQPQLVVPIAPPSPPLPTTPAFVPTQPVKEKSLDQLLDDLELLRKQKAELEKKEQDLIKVIQQKADKQADRMKQLGLMIKVPSTEPSRIGRIFLQGIAEKDEKQVQKMLDFSPGQVLEYPMLEQARVRLTKAGYQMVVVEVQPKQSDAQYLDILVKVGDKEK